MQYVTFKSQPQLYNVTRSQPYPQFPKNPHPPSEVYQCRVAPTCPSTAYQGAKTLCIHTIWMWDAVYRAMKLQPWLYNITRSQPYPQFPNNPHPPSEVYQCTGAPTCPPTVYQGAKTLCIYINMDVGCSLQGYEASTMTLQHHSDSTIPPISQ